MAAESLGVQLAPDVGLTLWTNTVTLAEVEWAEFDTTQQTMQSSPPWADLITTPWEINRIRSCTLAGLDANGLTDWILLIHHPSGLSTVEHWEGDEGAMVFKDLLFSGPAPPGRIVALTFGSLDGDASPDILTIEDPTGLGVQVVRHYELGDPGGWGLVDEFPIGVPGPTPGCAFGDRDRDGDVDLVDLGAFDDCLLGPGGGLVPADCVCMDGDEDGDVDLEDFQAFQLAFTGSLFPVEQGLVALTLGSLDGDAKPDVLTIHNDVFNETSAIDHYEYVGGQLNFVRNLVTEPINAHRFQALDLAYLDPPEFSTFAATTTNGIVARWERDTDTELLVIDWFFFQTVHQLQLWKFVDDRIELRRMLRESFPPAEMQIDVTVDTFPLFVEEVFIDTSTNGDTDTNGTDTNSNGIPDIVEQDCNTNGQYDFIDVCLSFSEDSNSNGIPDECDCPCNGDVNGDMLINPSDVAWIQNPTCFNMPASACPQADVDCSGTIDAADVAVVMCQLGQPPPGDPACCAP